MSKPEIPLDIVRMVGGLILSSAYRDKVDVGFQYELADSISRLVHEDRKRSVRKLERDASIHRQLADEVCDDEGEKYHIEMAGMLTRIASEIGG